MLTDSKFNGLVKTVQEMYAPKPVAEASMMKDDGVVVHNCAKHVQHESWGQGNTIAEEHAAPDAQGNIAWYDVEFAHGIEKAVPTADLQILAAESHGHKVKKMKEEAENIAEGGETGVVDLGTNAESVKAAANNTKENKAQPGTVAGAKEDGEKEVIKQGSSADAVKEAKEDMKSKDEDDEEDEEEDDDEDKEVDETIIYKPFELEITEAADNYDAHFKAMMKKHGIKHPGELETPEKKKAFFNAVDASYKAKNEDVFLEAASYLDVQSKMKSHQQAGHKVSDYKTSTSGGKTEYSFVVTRPDGKRSRHVYHATGTKVQSMSPAPKSSMAQGLDDEDDK